MSNARALTFDPVAVGRSECAAWAAYYRREWFGVLRGAVGMARYGFSLNRLVAIRAAWHVLRANQAWAPYPVNRPDAARRHMARFYRVVNRAGRLNVDEVVAADLEVAWWHAHRMWQHQSEGSDEGLVDALVALYAYVYQAEPAAVRLGARLRVQAMHFSDTWVAAGCDLDDPNLAAERQALIASYTALRDASDRGQLKHGGN